MSLFALLTLVPFGLPLFSYFLSNITFTWRDRLNGIIKKYMCLLGSVLLATTFHSRKGVQFGNTYSYFVGKKRNLFLILTFKHFISRESTCSFISVRCILQVCLTMS